MPTRLKNKIVLYSWPSKWEEKGGHKMSSSLVPLTHAHSVHAVRREPDYYEGTQLLKLLCADNQDTDKDFNI